VGDPAASSIEQREDEFFGVDAGEKVIERDLIAFLAQRRGVPEAVVRKQYIAVKKRHKFGSRAFRDLMVEFYDLLSPFYGEHSEEELIASYRYHAALHLYRHISYLLRHKNKYDAYAAQIVGEIDEPLVIVDYGSGLGHLSAALAEIRPRAKVYLVEVDALVLDFAVFRFERMGIDFEVIPVTEACIYPELPRHNVCIALEVFEHLMRPLVALAHIREAMDRGGLLFHSGGNRGRQFFHVSPNLEVLHAEMLKDFEPIGPRLLRKTT
jgi:2-polyprenyl-3-methyl-5-hydroxy-6-metoxy-1,4-benzoquinol methylase